jgi:uncharacterized protein YcnI
MVRRRPSADLLVLAFAVAVATRANAHPLVQQLEAPVGEPVTVTMSVISEAATPMVGAEIELAPSFVLDRAAPGSGWTASTSGRTVEMRGPAIPLGQAVFVSLSGQFEAKGAAKFPVTTHAEDGTTVRWHGPPEGPLPAVVIYAGIEPPLPPGAERSGGRSWMQYAGIGLIAVGVVLFVVEWRRRRRPALTGDGVDGAEDLLG